MRLLDEWRAVLPRKENTMTEKTTDERIKALEAQINSLGSQVTNLTMDIVKLKSKDQIVRK